MRSQQTAMSLLWGLVLVLPWACRGPDAAGESKDSPAPLPGSGTAVRPPPRPTSPPSVFPSGRTARADPRTWLPAGAPTSTRKPAAADPPSTSPPSSSPRPSAASADPRQWLPARARLPPEPDPEPEPLSPAFFTALESLPRARELHIRDDWNGLSDLAPVEHRYDLRRTAEGFRMRVSCRAADNEVRRPAVEVSAARLRRLLTRLATVEVEPGPYRARRRHTDDYPDLELEAHTPAGIVRFESRSQGQHHTPWGVRVDDEEGTVTSPLPNEVLDAIVALAGWRRCDTWLRRLRRQRR